MHIRGDINDTVCVKSYISGNGGVYLVVPRQPYTLERSDGRAEAKI